MGKYMRKAKVSGEVAVMEVAGTGSLGVRTRSRTLALQKSAPEPSPAAHYLELRSRRLEKILPPTPPQQKKKVAGPTSPERRRNEAEDEVEAEVSFGENVFELEAMMERRVRFLK